MRVVLEKGKTAPIYQRIATAFAKAFQTLGHEAIFVDTSGADPDTYAHVINHASIDYYLITNDSHFVYERTSRGTFIFEEMDVPKLFIHHDASITAPARNAIERERVDEKLSALQRCEKTSTHFCIELGTLRQLQKLGIQKAFEFFHASEFSPPPAAHKRESRFGISFVGHLMASFSEYPSESLDLAHHMQSLAYQRLARSSTDLQPELERLANCPIIQQSEFAKGLSPAALFQHLLHELTKLTMPYRGELINQIARHHSVDIIGGDLSYGTNNHPLLKIKSDNVRYHPATQDYQDTQRIYASSTVNLNISSLQFDSAINNRVFDVLFSGGFLITDRRSQIARLIPELQPFTFDTPEELVDLTRKFADPSAETLRFEITRSLHEKYSTLFSYEVAAGFIVQRSRSGPAAQYLGGPTIH